MSLIELVKKSLSALRGTFKVNSISFAELRIKNAEGICFLGGCPLQFCRGWEKF